MFVNVRFNLDQTYKPGTDPAIVKRHLYEKKPSPKHFKDSPVGIYIWVSSMGQQFKVHTGYKIHPMDWDFISKQPKKTYEHYSTLVVLLGRMKARVESNILTAHVSNPNLTYEEIQDIAKSSIKEENPKPRSCNFMEALDQFIEEKCSTVKPNTRKKYHTFRKVMWEFKNASRMNLNFHNIDGQFEVSYKKYLAEQRGLLNSTIDKYLKCLKVFMRWAIDREYTTNDSFKKFKPIKYETEVIFLNQKELDSIASLSIDHRPGLMRVRDFFLFQCYTGQRFGDVKQLSPKEIVQTERGWEWRLYQQKGNKPKKIIVPLLDSALTILWKYYNESHERVFPTISNQKTNKCIKELCKMAGINDPSHQVKYSAKRRIEFNKLKYECISSHTARKTFVTLSLEKGMSPDSIMKITGHESYSTMNLYKKVVDDYVRSDFEKAWGK